MPRRLRPLLIGLALALGAFAAHAVTVTTSVTDRGGKPLPDAVVMLVPKQGSLPVKPMSGVEISQVRRQFQPRVTVVTAGTSIAFPNADTVRHQVYSFSPAKTFELKLYSGVPAAPVLFDKPGIAVLGCNIHDQMVAWVIVVDTPLYARTSAAGTARLEGVPPGSYEMRLWHPELADPKTAATMPLVVGATDLDTAAPPLATAGFAK